ncbi:hypothetical protein C8J56DRAFT_134507 [Mycena floridula]|nr:hypothetical protein C8J56DRAFT_134507 [Mycena floridula]
MMVSFASFPLLPFSLSQILPAPRQCTTVSMTEKTAFWFQNIESRTASYLHLRGPSWQVNYFISSCTSSCL